MDVTAEIGATAYMLAVVSSAYIVYVRRIFADEKGMSGERVSDSGS